MAELHSKVLCPVDLPVAFIGLPVCCGSARGSIIKDDLNNNTEVWKFDKRFYTDPKVALKVSAKRWRVAL
jgi:hypothetical protein